ncbi:MAG: hypothetical protein AAF205_03570 [Pseudomonadota bacterium]
MATPMGFHATLAVLVTALALLAVSLIAVRRRVTGFRVSFVPWHAIMLVAIILAVLMAAHLPSVWPK